MPNVTYIKFIRNFFNATNGQLPFAAIHRNVSNAYPDNVILLIEEHNSETDDDDVDDGFHMRSTTSVTLMIMAWVLLIIGFTLCWCFQLFEKQKTQMQIRQQQRRSGSGADDYGETENGGGGVSFVNVNQTRNGTQALESFEGNERRRGCFGSDQDGEQLNDEIESGNRDRTSDTLNPGDVIRRYDMDVESLPSYTIVSGLPTYDDALEEFRKAGLILKPPIPVIKIFDSDTKDSPPGDGLPEYTPPENTTCVCGGGTGQIIELNPEHLKILSQKRLSLQISFNAMPTNIRRNSRPRVDLCQQVGRNNLLRAQRDRELMLTPEIHRSSSMTLDDERFMIEHRLRKLEQHRGSIS
ncbi:uncharacterized protein LOC129941363 isoform X1 [Eupeodes corollae]|uniref:uncharacterized protein LOC129941363 isoform X1 n=1 Tax=Eupeodes corollae TaxID=290404 RepID=UPI002490C1A7|nr:uncharacterized protein LOC129941363 isoform X1 [Eupeodes corollae]